MRSDGRRRLFWGIVLCSFLFILGCAGAVFRGRELPNKVAILPFANLSEDFASSGLVMSAFRRELEKRNVDLVDEDALREVLREKRVRTFGYLSEDVAAVLGERLGVRLVLVGCVVLASREENPKIGLTARLIDTKDGRVVWAEYSSATGDEFASLLKLGKIDTLEGLVPKAVGRLLESFSSERPPILQQESTFKIAVMPFENKTGHAGVGVMTSYFFLVELFKSERFDIVEYGNIRDFLVASRMRPTDELPYETIQRMSDILGVDGILLGSVSEFFEGYGAAIPPRVEVMVRLLDAHRNRILWYESMRATGGKTMALASWEETKPLIQTAYEAVTAVTRKLEQVRWY